MLVLLARHGQTDWNAAGRIQGASDIALNARGRAEARALAERLLSRGAEAPRLVYTSPLSRARETAEIAAAALGVPVIPAQELTELNFGRWEGCTWKEIGRRWPMDFERYSADRLNYVPPGGESYADMLARALPFVTGLRLLDVAGCVLCVAHSAVLRALLAHERGIGIPESYKKLRLPNAALFELKSLV